METIENEFAPYYSLTKAGELFNTQTNKQLKPDSSYCFRLKTLSGNYKKISLKALYKLVYGEIFCIDNIPDLIGEEWRAIPNTDYLASSKGRIKSLKGIEARILKPSICKGYERVDLVINGEKYSKLVARLVALCFLDAPENAEQQLHHKDGNKRNNASNNLEWLSPEEHRARHKADLHKLK